MTRRFLRLFRRRGGGDVYRIDAYGATPEAIARLERQIKAANRRLDSDRT